MIALGEFQVELKPLDAYNQGGDGAQLGRVSIDKSFTGDLTATSAGEMLSAWTSVKGSAGYVAIEQVSGLLAGKKGSFTLQHFGIMAHGENKLILEVVPDSATEQLVGLSGTMAIIIESGKHLYEFEYEIASADNS